MTHLKVKCVTVTHVCMDKAKLTMCVEHMFPNVTIEIIL